MTIDTTSIRRRLPPRLPPLPRSFVRGFLSGALVVLVAGLGIVLALQILASPAPDSDWPVVLKAGDCRYSGSTSGAFRINADRTASDLADVYAHVWSGAGWNVATQVSGQYAVLTATRAMMTYTVELFQQGQLVQAVSNGRQCEP